MNLLVKGILVGCVALVLPAGCKSQGVGERCTVSLNSDCEEGLTCFQAGVGYGVCCPNNATGQTCVPGAPENVDAAAATDAAGNDGSATDESSADDGSTDGVNSGDGATE